MAVTDGSHRCKTCRWDRLNSQDRSCWKCGSKDLEEVFVITLEEPKPSAGWVTISGGNWMGSNATVTILPMATTAAPPLTRFECGHCKGVHYATKPPEVWPCLCTREWESS